MWWWCLVAKHGCGGGFFCRGGSNLLALVLAIWLNDACWYFSHFGWNLNCWDEMVMLLNVLMPEHLDIIYVSYECAKHWTPCLYVCYLLCCDVSWNYCIDNIYFNMLLLLFQNKLFCEFT
jgi:hypothetical protein